jgi:N-acetylglucosaminyldiphosphoundecaprenol N-acetyl-beta-D-mannosaminyltransferase
MAGVGALTQAPRWMQRSGFDWLYRCLHEPRVQSHYFSTVSRFILAAVSQRIHAKKYEVVR